MKTDDAICKKKEKKISPNNICEKDLIKKEKANPSVLFKNILHTYIYIYIYVTLHTCTYKSLDLQTSMYKSEFAENRSIPAFSKSISAYWNVSSRV